MVREGQYDGVSRPGILCVTLWIVTATVLGIADARETNNEGPLALRILEETGIKGGLIVHVGCGDGKLTAALCACDSFVVHGLDAEEENVRRAREFVQSKDLYGQASIDRFDGKRLPYIDNCVNLVVMQDAGYEIRDEEVMRVLAPGGVMLKISPETRHLTPETSIRKPRPDTIDEWTHYLHDPSNNAVAHDTAIEPLGHLQWVGGPKWSRQHDHMSSSSAMVSSGGRNFYIFDEAHAASIQLPSDWQLIARDAFNGKILWKRPIESWHTRMWRLKSGPASLPRRLVAIGDTVYVTLSLEAPVTALDAATGQTIRTYKGTRGAEEILFSEGVLFLVVPDSPMSQPANPREHNYRWGESPRSVMAVEADTGKILWRKPWRWVVQLTLAVHAERVLFFDGEKIVCLDRENGDELWRSETIGERLSVPSYFGPTLVVYEDVVLFSGSESGSIEYHVDNGTTMTALAASTGKKLWTAEHPPSGYRSPEDILVLNGLVWSGAVFNSSDSGVFTGRDLHTGEVKVEFPPDVRTHWFHHRCYRAKATDKYILASRTGIEFVDVEAKHWTCHHWVRGACLYGIMPANGLIYNPPHPCACYLEAKLYGFNALAPRRKSKGGRVEKSKSGVETRVEKGTAYGQIANRQSPIENPHDWSTYRRDSARSGFTRGTVPARLKGAWETKLGGRPSAVVVAGGKLFVASVDDHTVHALDAGSGKSTWSYTAGGRVDSPPTIWQGRALFGSADGYVYCLRASDGALVWRFRAAPVDRRLMAFEQVESVWPVHGSVLVDDGIVWCVAGRSMFVDGGLRLLRLDALTGKKLSETILDDRDPDSGDNLQVRLKGLNMPVALPDILSSDERYVYMRSQKFNKQGERLEIETPTGNIRRQQGEGAHLFCPTGFLDDAYWHRSYWVFGQRWKSGAGGYYQAGRFAPSGRLLVFDDETVYGYSRKPQYFKWTTPLERQLFASSKSPEIVQLGPAPKGSFTAAKPVHIKIAWQWSQDIPLYVRAMVLADQTLFLAGPPDIIDEEKTLKNFASPDVQAKLAEQREVLDGTKGSVLWVASAADGQKLAEYKLDGLPVFDGMAAANGRLYLTMTDGRVLCYGAR